MKQKIFILASVFCGLLLVLTANAQSNTSSASANTTNKIKTTVTSSGQIQPTTATQLITPFIQSIQISPTQTVNTQSSTCTACAGGEPTGQTNTNGCPVYICPTNVTNSTNSTCPAPNCIGAYKTGEYHSDGCPVIKCPNQTCPENCVCNGEVITCLVEPPTPTCSVCVGGEPTGNTDSNGCPIYSCPTKPSCPVGCICSGDTTTCPTKGIKPIEATISGESGGRTVFIEKTLNGDLSFQSEKTPTVMPSTSTTSGTVTATTKETLIIKENKMSVETSAGNKEIKILPEEASSKAVGAVNKVNTIELKVESEQPIYSVMGTKQVKLFFAIPVSMQIETKVSAESGDVISVNKPWWSFLTR